MITLEESGRRIYFRGNTFPVKDALRSLGAHWDAEAKAWWIGSNKREEAEALLAKLSSQESEEKADAATRVRGKAEYKGRSYYIIAESRDGQSLKLTTLDGQVVFWARLDAGAKVTKRYNERPPMTRYGRPIPGSGGFPTLGSLRRFVEDKKAAAKGDCPRCRSMMASGKWAPYQGSGDYEECPVCGVTVQIRY